MNLQFVLSVLFGLLLTACSSPVKPSNQNKSEAIDEQNGISLPDDRFDFRIDTPVCTDQGCSGTYRGVEFISDEYVQRLGLTGNDIAHNYSNVMCDYVGRKLKELYREGKYSKVDLRRIQMTTRGMGDGDDFVEYKVYIPIVRVGSRNQAMTAFDHSGGWGHTPALTERKQQLLRGGIVKGKRLYISPLKKTPEGLQEYWIQWKHVKY